MPSSAGQTCALRSEEHTSELQSHSHLVCRLLLRKKRCSDRKSTRLNSSHNLISYAVFCLKQNDKLQDMRYPEIARRRRDIGMVFQRFNLFLFFFNNAATAETSVLSQSEAMPV